MDHTKASESVSKVPSTTARTVVPTHRGITLPGHLRTSAPTRLQPGFATIYGLAFGTICGLHLNPSADPAPDRNSALSDDGLLDHVVDPQNEQSDEAFGRCAGPVSSVVISSKLGAHCHSNRPESRFVQESGTRLSRGATIARVPECRFVGSLA